MTPIKDIIRESGAEPPETYTEKIGRAELARADKIVERQKKMQFLF